MVFVYGLALHWLSSCLIFLKYRSNIGLVSVLLLIGMLLTPIILLFSDGFVLNQRMVGMVLNPMRIHHS